MKKVSVNVGDIFLIPFENQFAVCKVIWISKRTKNVFSFTIKDKLVALNRDGLNVVADCNNVKITLFIGQVEVFYTSIEKLRKGEWEIIGNVPLKKEEHHFLYHNIGGRLCKGDEEIRPLNVEEFTTVPKMLVAGLEAINNFLKMGFDKN